MSETMGVLGPKGTHSEAAASYLNERLSHHFELVTVPDLFECLQDVETGRLDTALVPVENSLEGAINITLDTLARSEALEVVRELIWPVHNQLMAKCDGAAITRIFSHPQPISQCRAYLQQHYPQAEIVKVASTARAAELVAAEPASSGWAAICTQRAGELTGLLTVAAEIQDNKANCTRFFQVRRRGTGAECLPKEKMLIICQIDGQKAGALYEVLKEFAQRGINMTRIESRPARTELGAYIFFFDLEYTTDVKSLQESIAAVAKKSIWLKNLGTFPVLTVE
ncbi:MAG: prephenate dehydratase [Selenomonas ruminantium]|jgi:prephenate dehydratase|nr:prephenate dehydratase [Selenomonas ruminantium]